MNQKYSPLFQSYTLNNGVTIKNRLVVAPLTIFASNVYDGSVVDEERTFLSNRAGDIGMFILAATLVTENGMSFNGQPKAIDASHLPFLKERAEIIKRQGAKAILQLHHGGKLAKADLLQGKDKIAPSDDKESGSRAATIDEIQEVIKGFATATDLAIQAGFDGIEIHAANKYIIQQFYSGHSNRREDEWGGSREKRMRFPIAIVDAINAVKEKSGKKEFIIGYRFSPEEPEELGLTMEDTFALLDVLKEKPIQYLHASLHDFFKHPRRGADTTLTRIQLIHQRIGGKLPLIGLGNLLTAEQLLEAFQTGWAEFIGFGKAVMINPLIGTLIQNGKEDEIITELDPEKEDRYGMPTQLWKLCLSGIGWLPKIKGRVMQKNEYDI